MSSKYNHIFFYSNFKNVIFFCICILFFYTLINYNYNYVEYIIFSVIIFSILYFCLNHDQLFYYNFLAIFIFLGFWFKFSLNIITDFELIAHVGNFKYQGEQISELLITSLTGIVGLFLPLIFQNFIEKKIKLKKRKMKNIKKMYFQNRYKIIAFLILFISFINLSNSYFLIFQKGAQYQGSINVIVVNFYKFMLMMGISALVSFIIFFEIKKNFFNSALLGLFESFFSSISVISRVLVFNHYVYFVGIFNELKKIKKKLNLKIIFLCLISILLILISNLIVKSERIKRYNKQISENKNISYVNHYEADKKKQNYFFEILINRFVGIDGVMAVMSNENARNFKQFKNAIFEDVKKKNTSFYYDNFLKRNSKISEELVYKNSKLEAQFSPGIIGFLSILNSNEILFLFCFTISLFIMVFEIILRRLFDNSIFISIIIFQIVYRIIHFGYNIPNTYQLILAIIICILFFISIEKILGKFKK